VTSWKRLLRYWPTLLVLATILSLAIGTVKLTLQNTPGWTVLSFDGTYLYYNNDSGVLQRTNVTSGGSGLPTGCTSPGAGALTCTGTVTANIGSFNSVGTNFTDVACGSNSVGNSNQVRFGCDGTNTPVFSSSGAAYQKFFTSTNPPTLNQVGNPTANATFQPTVDATVLFKQFNGTNAVDVFDVQDKAAHQIIGVDLNGILRLWNNGVTLGSNGILNVNNGVFFGTNAPLILANNLIINTAPTIAAAGCGGAAAAISGTPNGTAAFAFSVGTTPTTTCTLTMPAATTAYVCDAFDATTHSTANGSYYIKQGIGSTTTSLVLLFLAQSGTATAPVASDVVRVKCLAY
jgi:hypothetical protein